jgi:hypothetical protein
MNLSGAFVGDNNNSGINTNSVVIASTAKQSQLGMYF